MSGYYVKAMYIMLLRKWDIISTLIISSTAEANMYNLFFVVKHESNNEDM